MDPNQTIDTTASRVNDVDPIRSDSRTETLPTGPTGTDGTAGTNQTQRIPSIGTSNQDRASSQDTHRQIGPRFQIEPQSLTEPELESGIIPERGSPQTK